MRGKVWIVGAGPGDPELLTVRALKILSEADVVIYTGSLLNPEILKTCPRAQKIDSFGKTLEEITDMMVRHAREGKKVVRLHDGDPSIFGSLAEQLQKLEENNIDYEIIPGVSSFLALASEGKFEYTVPYENQTVVITRYPGKTPVPEDIEKIAEQKPVMVFFLSATLTEKICNMLKRAGWDDNTPCVIGYRVTWKDQKIIRTTLAEAPSVIKNEGIKGQAILVFSKSLWKKGTRSHLYSENYARSVKASTQNLKLEEYKLSLRKRMLSQVFKKGISLITLTKGGIELASKLARSLDFAPTKLFVPQKFEDFARKHSENFEVFSSVKDALRTAFESSSGIIAFISLGALVRLSLPYIKSKEKDPALLCVNETGQFVIPVLSGHLGGANDLAREVASILSATPVITTASDSLRTVPVDILGRELGWKVEADHDTIVKVSSAVVNDEKVALVQECGTPVEQLLDLPQNIVKVGADEVDEKFSACLFVSYRKVSVPVPAVFYRPPCICVGVGFDKGVSARDIFNFVIDVLEQNRISPLSIGAVATVKSKWEDEEFQKFYGMMKQKFGAKLFLFEKEKLKNVKVQTPSVWAQKYLGIPSVSEASALAGAGENSKLLVPKQKTRGITCAVALSQTEIGLFSE